ncbi:cytochrome c oxidase subunit 3 [Stella sp.]|uniref:cytochrome c oxidase subunit 3 n=1 Tax=Stella sp. TaxID=2912054 RepID=UPI0035B384B3
MANNAHAKTHPYHLVDPSPWPFLGSMAALWLAFMALLFMHPDMLGEGSAATVRGLGVWKIIVGLAPVLLVMALWWRDVVREGEYQGHHTPVVQIGLRYGMALFIASEVMFFVAFFWAFFDASLYPREAIGGVWPPKDIQTFDAFELPFLNTLILLLSGCTVTWAHHELIEGNRAKVLQALGITVLLGLSFTALQAYEYSHAAFGFRQNIYSSTFYMATGFHGFHVMVGTIFLAVCWFRVWLGHFKPNHHFGFEAAAWYWHFVDVVWLFLFVCIYWWGA